jgi:predicted RNA-binding protein associated with RNAse of E/G family
MKPVERSINVEGKPDCFEITDLFLDLWINPDGTYEIQDEDEFEDAVRDGAIDAELEKKAWNVLNALIAEVEAGHFESRMQAVLSKAQLPDLSEYVAKLP